MSVGVEGFSQSPQNQGNQSETNNESDGAFSFGEMLNGGTFDADMDAINTAALESVEVLYWGGGKPEQPSSPDVVIAVTHSDALEVIDITGLDGEQLQ